MFIKKFITWKVSIFKVFLVRIQSKCRKIWTRKIRILFTLINTLKWVFKNNGYPKNFIDLLIHQKKKLNYLSKIKSLKVRMLQLVFALPYAGKSFLDLRSRLTRTTEENITSLSLMLFQDPPANLVTCLDSRILSRKKCSWE